jgi:hypothetical protein
VPNVLDAPSGWVSDGYNQYADSLNCTWIVRPGARSMSRDGTSNHFLLLTKAAPACQCITPLTPPAAEELARLPSAVVFDDIMLESAFDWL